MRQIIDSFIGPCHRVTEYLGQAAVSVLGPIEIHRCTQCGNSMVRMWNGQWVPSTTLAEVDPVNCANIRALVNIEPIVTRRSINDI